MRCAPALVVLFAATAAVAACGSDNSRGTPVVTTTVTEASEPPTTGRETMASRLPKGTVTRGLKVPWDMVFLPGGGALVTERGGNVRRLDKNLKLRREPVARIKVQAVGEGGLLGMTLDPGFKRNHYLYLYRTTASGNEVVRYVFGGGKLTKPVTIVRGIKAGVIHDGGRIRFGPDGALYITTGETGDSGLAQQPESLNGKILRVKDPREGTVDPEIVSLGHRNVQGLDWQPKTELLYATEFGPDAHDEINQIRDGQNYGWPDFEGKDGPGPALVDYPEVIAPSGATFVHRSGSRWSGDLLVACLRGEQLRRITFDGNRVVSDKPMYEGKYGRLRQVVEGPDGSIYLLTNNTDGRGTPRSGDDRIIRIVPPRA